MLANLQTTVDERPIGRFWIHMKERHAQGLSTTSLYPANIVHGEVMGQRFRRQGLVVRREEKSIFEVPA